MELNMENAYSVFLGGSIWQLKINDKQMKRT